MIEQIKQRYKSFSDDQLVEILKTGRPRYTANAMQAAEELLKERNYVIDFPINRADPAGYSRPQEPVRRSRTAAPASSSSSSGSGLKTAGIFGGLLLAIFLVGKLLSGPATVQITIDNPTTEPIKLSIDDGEEMHIGPSFLENVYVETGERVIKINGEEEKVTIKKGEKYILNPTKSEYVKEEVVYSANNNPLADAGLGFDQYKKIPFNIFLIDSLPVMGPYKQVTDLLISEYDYHLDQSAPKSMQVTDRYSNISKVKVHRMKDFTNIQERDNIAFKRRREYKKFGLSKEAIKDEKASADYLKDRDNLLRKSMNGSKKLSGDEKPYMVFMEVNRKGSYALVSYTRDGASTFSNAHGKNYINESTKKGSHEAAKTFISQLSKNKSKMTEATEFALPQEGQARFGIITNKGKRYSFEQDLLTVISEGKDWAGVLGVAKRTLSEVKRKGKKK